MTESNTGWEDSWWHFESIEDFLSFNNISNNGYDEIRFTGSEVERIEREIHCVALQHELIDPNEIIAASARPTDHFPVLGSITVIGTPFCRKGSRTVVADTPSKFLVIIEDDLGVDFEAVVRHELAHIVDLKSRDETSHSNEFVHQLRELGGCLYHELSLETMERNGIHP